MKVSLIIFVIFVSLNVTSQNNKLKDNFTLSEVIQVNSLKKNEIYSKAKSWILSNLKSNDNFVEFDDTDSSRIFASGSILLKDRSSICRVKNSRLDFKITILFKEGRYKYIIDNMIHSYIKDCYQSSASPVSAPLKEIKFGKRLKNKIYDEIEKKLISMIDDLNESFDNNENNDW